MKIEPKWHAQQVYRNRVSPEIYALLTDTGSLTEKIQQISSKFSLQVLSQKFAVPFSTEQRILNLSPHQQCLIREVMLYGDDNPWVFARTIIPEDILAARNNVFMKLGNRPLREILFKNTPKRSKIEIARILSKHSYFKQALISKEINHVWGRRSIFYYRQFPLLVSEIFSYWMLKKIHPNYDKC